MTVRLGIMGLSEGNGHPFSWAAIFNGYSPEHMADCGFPGIPRYLAEQSWPEAQLQGAQVTHVWTQARDISEHIAKASLVPNIVDDAEQMLGEVDAVLLARDDAENHLQHALPFLNAGLPIYIDKPVALSLDDLDALYAHEKYTGQIFSCSALRYARELKLNSRLRETLGDIRHIQASTPRSWAKYAVHIIEPVLNFFDALPEIRSIERQSTDETTGVKCQLDGNVSAEFTALGYDSTAPISICVTGEKRTEELVFRDSFTAFKSALADFLEGIEQRECRSPRVYNEHVVRIIESGMP